jgi:hypothetical protein
VLDPVLFTALIEAPIAEHDPQSDDVVGQHFIPLYGEILSLLSCGVGRRTNNPEDYVARVWRDHVQLFLRRERAAELTGAAAIVYTMDAYAADPEVDAEELARFRSGGATHVLVAVLAFGGPESKPEPSAWRFVNNLAGGNRALDNLDAQQIKRLARQVVEYNAQWCTVAD